MASKLRPTVPPPKAEAQRPNEGYIAGFQPLAVLKRCQQTRESETDLLAISPDLAGLDSAVDAESWSAKVCGQTEDLPPHSQHCAPSDFFSVRFLHAEDL